MTQAYCVAILGATGAVGSELLSLLEERNFPVSRLKLLASSRSAGQQIVFRGQMIQVEALSEGVFDDVDLVLASAGGETSKLWAPKAVAAGAVVIDNSSAFRMDPTVPLIVPEVNPEAASQHQGIIANPNCTTILMSVAIWPLYQVQPIQRIVAATYQSASGAGARAMQELKTQSQAILAGQAPEMECFPYPLAFNLFPHNSDLDESGYCAEEIKMIQETRKIFGVPDLRISATCVRVPVLRAHSEALNIEFEQPFDLQQARQILEQAPGIKLVENWERNYFPMPIDASGKDEVLVGRLRQDLSHACGLELWLSGDQIRKGAALNAVQIAELLSSRKLIRAPKAELVH